ncbi:MAG: ankyrin repeat domain-containing protein [Polyangiales bacterium]
MGLDDRDEEGLTALHRAAMRSLSEVERLLAAGAGVNVRSEPEGATPLHFACASHRVEIVGPLLRAGARVDLSDYEGATPLLALLTSAESFGTSSVLVAHVLRKAGDDGSELAKALAEVPVLLQQLGSMGFRIACDSPGFAALDELSFLADALEMSWDAEAHGYSAWAEPRLAIVAERLPLALESLPEAARSLDPAFFDELAARRPTALGLAERSRIRSLRASYGS